jgi:hypothetical protein
MNTREELKNYVDEFLSIYPNRPIRDNHGGCLSVNLFHIFYVLKKYKPKVVIESGVFKGQTTWLINQVLPESLIVCIDPNLQQIVYRSKNAQYMTNDFLSITKKSIADDVVENSLIIFDDHQDAPARLLHAHALGFKLLYFDDNYPEYRGHRHLSIQAVMDGKHDPGFVIPESVKATLEAAMKEYTILPPVLPYDKPITMESSYITIPPVFNDVTEHAGIELFGNDLHNYRWHTLITLN